MRIGIIDLGTNSVRFDVHQVSSRKETRLLHREKLMIRLGQGVFLTHKLDPDAIQRSLQAFLSFKRTADLFKTEKIVAFATSALREAEDAALFIDLIRQKTQIKIQIITGDEEAKWIARGILAHAPPIKGYYGLIDIGGGSTEISICRKKEVYRSASFPLGTARLQQLYLKGSPPRSSDVKKADPILSLKGFIRSTLLARTISEAWPKAPQLIGSSGTIRAIQRILKKTTGEEVIHRRSLSKLLKRMKTMNQARLSRLPGMETKRVDMILAGGILLEECMASLGSKSATLTEFSLRDGILAYEIQLLFRKKRLKPQFKLEALKIKAKQLGYDEAHAIHVEKNSALLFDRLTALHRLNLSWKHYLRAAAILHDLGRIISPIRHEVHSGYLIQNIDIPEWEPWESEFIKQLCIDHPTRGLTKPDSYLKQNRVFDKALFRLLAILQVADALDRSHSSQVTIEKVVLKKGKVILEISSANPADLEILRVEQKKTLFETVFRCQLVVEHR